MYTWEMNRETVVLVRYKNVSVSDRRECESTFTQDLFGMEFADEVKNYTLKNDPVWKGIVEKYGRLGYDLSTPEQVVRIQKTFDVGDQFYWDFDRYDEAQKQKQEQDGVLCLPS